MKKKLITIFLSIAMILGVVGVVAIPQPAEACFLTSPTSVCINEITAIVGNTILVATSYLVTAAGALLSLSMKLTLNIKDIYDNTAAIGNTWKVIRDISSIFIIFILLYASISTIIGIGKSGIKEVIGKVIIVGLLINFSLFFTKVAIDASNLISMQFYRAIAPQSADAGATGRSYLDGGLSDIFMNSLKIQNIYHPSNADIFKDGKGEGSIFTSIIIATFGGSVLMVIAALSFLAAAVTFAIRTAILLLLMVFSPLYFVGKILPQIEDRAKKWEKMLFSQLVFMPAYLLLMYVALRVIGDKGFMSFIQTKDPNGGFIMNQVSVIIQYFIAIIFINAPLIAALELGGKGADWAGKATEGLNKWLASRPGAVASFSAQHSLGRAAKAVKESDAMSSLAAKNPNLAILANKTLGSVSGASFGGTKGGYDKRFKEYSKARADLGKNIGMNEADKYKVTTRLTKEMSKWEGNLEGLKKEVAEKQEIYNNMVAIGSGDSSGATKAKENLEEALNKLKDSGDREAVEKAMKKKLEGEGKNEAILRFADKLEGSSNPVTSSANKKAAEEIRKDLSKTDDKRIQEMIKKALESGDEK